MNQLGAADKRRQNLRVILFIIILATLPFYCVGIVLLGTANNNSRATLTPTQTNAQITRTLASNTPIRLATVTSIGGTSGQPLPPTPGQYNPIFTPVVPPITFPTNPPTFQFPTSTTAPSLTPLPSNTQPPPPSDTALPLPSETPFVPSNTPVPIPDSDGDGVTDNFDLCPLQPGFDDPTRPGCPLATFTPTPTETIIPIGP